MDRSERNIRVGDHVTISRPTSTQRFAAHVQRASIVTAVRPMSFDAGGLCFRYDGREWNGHNRVRFVPSDEMIEATASLGAVDEASRDMRAKEDATLAFLLSSRHEMDWLNLGLDELRRIAALHGFTARGHHRQGASSAPGFISEKHPH